ncbi:UDP-3-O-(3-hydroxymyristoyl)glucosamine N-acyltransferase [Thiofilum flexile]|uniref:UDP-3-O-(3-hydroxymyristoyl)glucosamine N-acyltransferase n=1 Tax=Thiofilum flexile TaxID=125627 RepID=UPI000365F980|nr:UDP-3-O-(3-hydroxymyristoyl)glucosamine N-acyltransferase [Thiofilum flexile]
MSTVALAKTLESIATYCGAELKATDPNKLISGVAAVDLAQAHELSYIRGGQYRQFLTSTKAGALILPPDLAAEYSGDCLIHKDPYLAYAQVVTLFYPPKAFPSAIHPTAVMGEHVSIADGVHIGAYVVIGAGTEIAANAIIGAHTVIGAGCRIGADTLLHPHVTLADDTEVGERCIIHSGAVLGADGFGFAPQRDGTWYKIPQVGKVVLGNDVEIGANTTIDRAALGVTRIGDGVKLDNLIQVGHNTEIGAHTAVAACTAIAGSAKIGRFCRIAGMCAIGGHLEIADHVIITATSMVTHSIRHAGVYSAGTTIQENSQWRKNAVRFHQLDKMARRLAELEKQMAALQPDHKEL